MQFVGVDLFAGAGGVTTGIELAKIKGKKIASVKACINHDPVAIESHAANHKRTIHFIEDIKNFDVKRFPKLKENEEDISYLWASLECTNFSNAKGGLPRDPDSRTLANHLFRYVEHLNPDYIFIENVREFMSWGDLDCNCKPISKDKGKSYLRWINKIKSYGYEYEYRILNSADYGAYTSRKRLFIIFARIGMPIVFPEATHSKNPDMFGLKKWKAVKDVLNLDDKGESIFGRKKNLSEKTYKRIYAGLIKYVAGGEDNWFLKYNSASNNKDVSKGNSINNPSPTITTHIRLGLVSPEFLIKYHGNGENILSVEDTCSTLSTKDRLGLIQPQQFLDLQFSNGKQNASLEKPNGALLTVPKEKLVTVEKAFIDMHYRDSRPHSIDEPARTITTNPVHSMVTAERVLIDQQYGQSKCTSAEKPLGSLTSRPKHSLITVKPMWLMDDNYNNVGKDINEPAPTILANRHQHYLMNPQFASPGSSVENPCFTLIAKMDKKPPYLVTTEEGRIAIEIYEKDSEYIRKIKEFMALYGIVDIKMRMLRIPELLRIQGFGEDYILKGTQAEQKKFIGNAVVPVIPKKMIEALYQANLDSKIGKLKKAV